MTVTSIESPKNSVYRHFLNLLSSRGISESGQAFIFGKKAINDVVKKHSEYIRAAVVCDKKDLFFETDRIFILSKALFKNLDIFGTQAALLVVAVPKMAKINHDHVLQGCNLVIPFQDPSNVGALLRSAAAFGVSNILLAPSSAHPFHPKSVRAASGTVFLNHYWQFERLEDLSLPKIALDKGGTDITHFKFPKDFVLVPGVEGPGLSAQSKDKVSSIISIPIADNIDSLNATVATSIALYSWNLEKISPLT